MESGLNQQRQPTLSAKEAAPPSAPQKALTTALPPSWTGMVRFLEAGGMLAL